MLKTPLHTRARIVVALLLAGAIAWSVGLAGAASETTVITADVVGASLLVNECTADPATSLGTVAAGAGSLTATAASDVCRVQFGGTSDAAQLRIGQRDGQGNAMTIGMEAPVWQERMNLPGRTGGVYGINANDAIAVGRSGMVIRTSDGGTQWTEWNLDGANWNDIEGVTGAPNTAWIGGEDSRMRRTNNALEPLPGEPIWTAHNIPAPWPASADIHGITATATTNVVAAGDNGWIARWNGTGWTDIHQVTGVGDITAIDAVDANNIIAVTSAGYILTTTNGGNNASEWSSAAAPGANGRALTDVTYGSTTRAYTVGSHGYVASRTGVVWADRSAAIGATSELHAVTHRIGTPTTAYVADEVGQVHVTTDAGVSWTVRSTGSTSQMTGIDAATSADIYTSAYERTFGYSDDGGATFHTRDSTLSTSIAAIDVSPVDGRRVLAVGSQGAVRRTTNGGSTWIRDDVHERSLLGVSLADDVHGWAVGDESLILATDDMGASWDEQTAPAAIADIRLTAVHAFDDARTVLAIGNHGTIIRTVNAGETWSEQSSGTSNHLVSLDAWEDELVVAAGANGTILRSTDTGKTWSTVPGASLPDAAIALQDIVLTSASTGFVTTLDDELWRTDDAGLTWQYVSTLSFPIRSLAAYRDRVVIGGVEDVIARSSDGGLTFDTAVNTSGRSVSMRTAVAVDTHVVYVAGDDGYIYRHDATTGAAVTVPNWGPPANDWDSGGFFGVCLQSVSGLASATWTPDADTCEDDNSDPWRALTATVDTAATTSAAGLGAVDLVWGFRATSNQQPGRYEAAVVFEVVVPDS